MSIPRTIAAALLLLALATPAAAQCTSNNFAPNTVAGRLGISPGPCQAIPFAVLVANLQGSVNVTLTGDVTGHRVRNHARDRQQQCRRVRVGDAMSDHNRKR